MCTKKAIECLRRNKFTVNFEYNLVRPKGERFRTFSSSGVIGKFLYGGFTKCVISKTYKTLRKTTSIIVNGVAKCNADDKDIFIPRIGKAISFWRAVDNFPEAKECLIVNGILKVDDPDED